MIADNGKSPQPPFQGGVIDSLTAMIYRLIIPYRSINYCMEQTVAHSYRVNIEQASCSPLKRGLGGFSAAFRKCYLTEK